MKFAKAFVLLTVILMSVFPAGADDRATTDEAKVMAVKAAAFIKDDGEEKAFAAFNQAGGQFHDRDLYVFVLDGKGLMKAHGASAALIGKDTSNLKDVDGKPFVKEFLAVKGEGWIDYKWRNPQTNAVEPKSAYIIEYPNGFVGVGAYKK
ncbi:cache domain-containing protein [Bradyrhizobium manausense]|uniref:cache domain-containing protein n=1 Tax=Bradyrhizobium manausense TaxID=989370 RepID=UPI001BA9233D|nr:cache domain-containing protein [Bradyrhizobium manausense]MBR0828618.1 cache domain-containing protein [Bradyrhizobium manausense]